MPKLIGEKREGGVRTRLQNGITTFEQDYHFWIEADNKYQSRYELLDTPGLPKTNITVFGNMICKSVNIERNPDKATYHSAVCTFSSEVEEGTSPTTPQQGDPTAWVPQSTVSFEPIEETMRKDLDGKPFRNSANQKFANGLIRRHRIASTTFVQFEEASTKLDEMMERVAINSVEFLGKPKYTLLLQLDSAVLGSYYGYRCWKVQYTLKYKPHPETVGNLKGGWYTQVLDSGDAYYPGGRLSGSELTPFYNPKQDVYFEGLLNGTGDQIPDQANGTPYFLNFREYNLSDFSFLKLQNF